MILSLEIYKNCASCNFAKATTFQFFKFSIYRFSAWLTINFFLIKRILECSERKLMQENKQIDRKGFLGLATFLMGGLITFLLGIPAISYIVSPAKKSDEAQDFIPLGAASKVEIGVPTLFKAKIRHKAGWIVDERELSFYVLTKDKRNYVAISNVCTHLSCRVRWVSAQEQFFCPCHNAVFDSEGNVESGPPPRPLDRYEVKEEDGQLFVANQ